MYFLRYETATISDSFNEISLTCSGVFIMDYEIVRVCSLLFSNNTPIPFKRANVSVARLSLLDDSY